MFEQAARQHSLWYCKVGGVDSDLRVVDTGMGTFLSDKIVLSSAHVWSNVPDHFDSPCVMHSSGVFRCEVLKEWPDWDVILLGTVERITGPAVTKTPKAPPEPYPKLSQERMYVGREVGMFSSLSLADKDKERDSVNIFTSGRISLGRYPTSANQKLLYGLSNTVIQRGFSGSAVFLADGSVVGVLVQALVFPIDRENLSWGRYVLPLVSPLHEIREEIVGLLNQS
jgi:hypothetical protein